VISEQQIREILEAVRDPEIGRPIGELGLLESVDVDGGTVRIRVFLPFPGTDRERRMGDAIQESLAGVDGIERLVVGFQDMSDETRDQLATELRGSGGSSTFLADGDTEVIAVASGKGGVGKSSVTANVAAALAAEGHRVGIMDADVYGFSIPGMMGVSGQPVGWNDMILPLEAHGVRIMSMAFFVSDETPIIWRGPMLHKAIQQFLGDVYWGDLDYLFVDLPPGTGDVSISLASFIPRGSMLVVTTPQDAARSVAERAGRMAQHPNIKLQVLGVVENMAGFVCPHCGEITDLFGSGGGRAAAEALGVPLLGSVPMQVSMREGGDGGTPIVVSDPDSPAGQAFRSIASEVARRAKSPVGRTLKLQARSS